MARQFYMKYVAIGTGITNLQRRHFIFFFECEMRMPFFRMPSSIYKKEYSNLKQQKPHKKTLLKKRKQIKHFQ